MTIAHLSDTHLGFRAYSRTTPDGFNQREHDVMRTFETCLEEIAERDPDIAVHAGDLFHVVRPSNATIVSAFRAITEFQARRRGKPFVIIGGNHDTPRTTESGNLLRLFERIDGVRLVTRKLESIEFPELDLEVVAVPSFRLLNGEPIEYAPRTSRRHTVLTLHGMARQAMPRAAQFDVDDTRHDRWSYVALGDYHSMQSFGANVCYAGSIDFTSTNIWDEVAVPKGWVWFDTDKGRIEPQLLSTRPVLDLPIIDALLLTPEDIQLQMSANETWEAADFPIVRQRIHNVFPSIRGKLSVPLVRELASRALSYQITTAPPAVDGTGSPVAGGVGAASTLEQRWETHIGKADLPAGMDRATVIAVGLDLLREVAEQDGAAA